VYLRVYRLVAVQVITTHLEQCRGLPPRKACIGQVSFPSQKEGASRPGRTCQYSHRSWQRPSGAKRSKRQPGRVISPVSGSINVVHHSTATRASAIGAAGADGHLTLGPRAAQPVLANGLAAQVRVLEYARPV
jgi:hypothetical protein